MQFVADGPDIPNAVLEAQEEDRLALFCGAGISVPNNLPLFKGLVERVRQELGADWSSLEQQEFDAQNYDRVLNLLEDEKERYSPAQVRQAVMKILATPEDPWLETHQALLDLARSRDHEQRIRLVTTNFDLLFEEAGQNLPVSSAPLLPVPKPHKWNSLVHLHGRIDDDQDPAGKNLVLTSADFGVAYLVERWASRFVSELFRHFTVLFIGYSVDDPVMRYLMDAIAAERRGDHQIQDAYALASFSGGAKAQEAAKKKWRSKNIISILYPESNDHSALHQTLSRWAADCRGGLTSRLNVITDLGRRDPAKLPPEAVSRFCWAIRHGSGAMARALADMGAETSLAWLPVLEAHGLLSGPAGEQGPQTVSLVDFGQKTREPAPLGPVAEELAHWLARHLANPELARWALDKGAHLHPHFGLCIQLRLDTVGEHVPDALVKFWRALTGSVVLQRGEDAYERLDLWRRIHQSKESWSPSLRLDLLTALTPCLALKRNRLVSALIELKDLPARQPSELSVSEIVSFECNLLAGDSTTILLDDFRNRPDYSNIILDIAIDLTLLLRRALDMHACLGGASEDHDDSYSAQPSIAPHGENRHYYQWTLLIDLVREAFDQACDSKPELARNLVRIWLGVPYPLFRRLVLYSSTVSGVLPTSEILGVIMTDPRLWLWPFHVQHELYRLLPKIWQEAHDPERSRMQTVICKGPPRKMYREDLEPKEWSRARDRSVWEFLARLERVPPGLKGQGKTRFQEISRRYPSWRLGEDESRDFPPVVGDVVWGHPTDISADELAQMKPERRLAALLEEGPHIEGRHDSWIEMIKADPAIGVEDLRRLLGSGSQNSGLLRVGLSAFRDLQIDNLLKRDLLSLLEIVLDQGVTSLAQVLVDILWAVSNQVDNLLRATVLEVWDRLLAVSIEVPVLISGSSVDAAINHPYGILAEALLRVLKSEKFERDQGLPSDVKDRLNRLASGPGDAARLARVLLGSHLAYLHFVDSTWTRERLIPCFDWSDRDESTSVWQGYLQSVFITPSLWRDIKPHFISGFDHLDLLQEHYKNKLAALVAVVAIEAPDTLPLDEARSCLQKIDDSGGLEAIAQWLKRKLDGVGSDAAGLWKERVGPWIQAVWPKEPRRQTSSTSQAFAEAVVVSGEAFPDAVDKIKQLLVPIERCRLIIEKLLEDRHVVNYTESALELMDKLTPSDPPRWFGDLKGFLDEIKKARPDLEDDPRYCRLREVAIRNDLNGY